MQEQKKEYFRHLYQRKKVLKKQTTQVKGKKRIVYSIQKKTKQTPPPFKNKEEYIGDTNEKTRGYDDYPSATDGCVRNLGEEHENEEDEEYSETTPEINYSIKSKISKGTTEEYVIISLFANNFSPKVIK